MWFLDWTKYPLPGNFSPNFDLETFKVKGHNPEKLFQQTQAQYFKNVYAKNHQSEIN